MPFGEPGGNDLPGVRRAVAFLVAVVTSKEAAATMTNKEAAQQIITAADEKIATFIDGDDICPPWPHPGQPPWLSIIASELTFVANTLQAGSLRTSILQVARMSGSGSHLDRCAIEAVLRKPNFATAAKRI